MEMALTILMGAALAVGIFFAFVGVVGLLRLPETAPGRRQGEYHPWQQH